MAQRSSASITVAATPTEVMAVIEDFASYPVWAGVKSAEVLTAGADGRPATVNLVIDAGIVKDDYVLAYDWDDVASVSWTLVRGTLQKSQEGSYSLTPVGEETRVDYELSIELAVPMLGLLKRKGEKMIMDTALKGLKKRVESLHP